MNDRRRNIIVLTTVVALLIGSLVVIFTKPTKLGLDLQGGVQLVYEARPTKQQPTVNQESLDRALDIMRDRVDSLGVAEPELQRSGANQIEVSLPGVKNAERAADQVGTTAQMYFYDWEPNVLDADCKTNPEEVNGGQQPISGLYNAVKQASKCPPEIDDNNTTNGLWYAFDKKSHAPINDGIPDESEGRARGGPRLPGPHRQGRDPRGARGHRRPARRRRPRPGHPPRPGRPVVGDQGQPGPRRHRHQEPRAELRERRRRRADRDDGVLATRAARRSPRRRARSPSAAPTTRRSTAACRTRSAPRTTSRSGSTTR